MSKNIGKKIRKNLSGKYSQKLLQHAKQSDTDAIKITSEKVIKKKTAEEATGDLIGNKTADKITKISKNVQKTNSETITNEQDKEILKKMYKYAEERQKITDDIRLI